MSTELARRNADTIEVRTMDDLARLSEMFAKSGYFQDAQGAAQVGVKILAGREIGFGPFASVNGFHIIQGKPAMGANLMAAAVKGSGKYDYRVREMSAKVCRIEFFQGAESIGVSEFTIEDARNAGTQNLKKFARNMLFARAMSNGVRWFCPDVFMGAAVYTPEELGAQVDGEGEIMDVPHRAEPAGSTPAQRAEAVPEGLGASAVALSDEGKRSSEPPAADQRTQDEDEFPEDPPAEVLEPGITREQVTLMGRAINEAQMDRDAARGFVSYMVGRELGDVRGLTQAEAARLIERWQDKRTKSGFGRDKIADDVQKWVDHQAMQAEEGEAA